MTTHLHLVPRSKDAWSYTSTPPIRLHGVILSQAHEQLYILHNTCNNEHISLIFYMQHVISNTRP